MQVNIPDKVRSLKNAFRELFAPNKDFGGLRSLFLIGSCAGEEDDLKDWYQDFDIHLFIDKVFASQIELDYIKKSLSQICEEFTNEYTNIDWDMRDRHWKLVPNSTVPLNLSIHATLVNRADYQRRVLQNPVLGWNMYQLCEVLLGDHPGQILSLLRPTPLDHLHSVGGTGWMIENFYRALWLLFTEPDEQDFFPYIAGYCWNVTSSVMLQYYPLNTGRPTTRKNALKFLQTEAGLPKHLHSDLERLIEYKRIPNVDEATTKELVNSTAKITNWMISSINDKLGTYSSKTYHPGVIHERDVHSIAMNETLGRSLSLGEIHYWIDIDEEDFYESFKVSVSEIQSRFPNSTSRELFEAYAWLINKNYTEMTKVYFWSELNQMRFLLSHDFDFSRGFPSLRAALWGWENGCQAFLQRLNETYIANGINDKTNTLAQIAVMTVNQQLSDVGLKEALPNCRNLQECAQYLATIIDKHSLLKP